MKLDFFTHTKSIDQNKPGILFTSLQTLLDSSSDMIFVKDINLTYVAGTQSFAEMLGKSSMAEVLNRTDYELFDDKDFAQRYITDDKKILASNQDFLDYMEPITEKNGEARYCSTSKYILRDIDGNAIGILGVSKDITASIKAHQQYKQMVEYMFTLPEDTLAAILIDVTDWRIIAQRRQEFICQYMPLFDTIENFLASALDGVYDKQSKTYQTYQQFSQEYLSRLYAQGQSNLEEEYQRLFPDGSTKWIREEWKFLSDPKTGNLNVMLLLKDLDSKKLAEEKLLLAAQTDEMTGLLNRAATRSKIQEFISGEGASGVHAVFMIDLDDFKLVNDTYGHQAGDTLLIQLAKGFRSCFRESDIIGRMGGDEFFVLAKNMPDQEAIKNKAEHLLDVVRTVYASLSSAVGSVSVGISAYPADANDFDELYKKADAALYKAKDSGKNRYAFSSDEQTRWSANALTRRYESFNSQVVDHSNSICYICDMETYDLLHITKAGMELYGMTRPEEYLGKKCYQVIMGLDEPCPFCTNSKLEEGVEYRWEWYNDNINKWFDRTSSIIHLDGRPRHLEIGRDITARREEISLLSGKLSMEDILFRCLHTLTNEKDLDTAVNLFLEAVGGFYQSNRAYLFEFEQDSGLMDNTFEWCSKGVSSEIENLQRIPIDVVSGWIKKFTADGEFSITSLGNDVDRESEEYRILEAQGIQSLMAAPLLKNGEIVGFIGVDDPRRNQGNLMLLRSVSEFVLAELEQRRLVKELEHMSFTDTLTGLNNRNYFVRSLKEYDRKTSESFGVFFVDINGLKTINDSHGQSFGDHVVKIVGRIISDTLSGATFRTGGGEFVALCENITRDSFQQETVALRSALDGDRDYSVSIGCAWSDEDESVQSLLKQAEEMLHADKRSYYQSVLREGRNIGSINLSDEVMQEARDGRFIVYYQPQVDIHTGKIIGAEALVRKKDEDGVLIAPNKFIPFYETEGVVGLVDMFVLDTSCATMRSWLDQGYDLHLSVNFSRVTLLEPGIVEKMCQICQKHNVPTSAITIEVTESISKMDHEQLRDLIQTINKAGFTISLDDFGSQYSNLAILAAMDFNEIKFDRSLVKALENNRRSQVVMENSVRMCHDLEGTTSLAEGIETEGQLELLLDYHCDYGQGYYFSKPVPPEEFLKLLENPKK